MTKQRRLILDIIQYSDKHLSAEDIYFLAKKEMPKIVMATIYNNLNTLTTQNLIRRVKISGGADVYDKNLLLHDHLICRKCGSISDISVGDFSSELERKYDIKIDFYELCLYHLCKDCKNNPNQ